MTALTLEGVSVRGRDRDRLSDVGLRLNPGELVLLVGPNGAGKSTLLRVLLGLTKGDEGRVLVGDRSVSALSAVQRSAVLAWLPQSPRLEVGLTAVELVASARFRFREPWTVACRVAREVLARRAVEHFAHRRMETLSGGEAQRVRVAALDAQEASWWLLDEPAAHLDPGVQLELLEIVRSRHAAGGGVLWVTHDLAMIPHMMSQSARLLGLSSGAVRLDEPLIRTSSVASVGRLMSLTLVEIEVEGVTHWVVQGAGT